MEKHNFHEIPIRSKVEMLQGIAEIMQCLHRGDRPKADLLIEELKARSILLSEEIQQDVLIFVEQVQFQYAYDPWHNITEEVQRAADHLIERLQGQNGM
jgi:hypothetical protein